MNDNYVPYTLAELGLLDRSEATALDHLTHMASSVINAPVALVSIIDKPNDRQFFKSKLGLPEPWDEKGETPLSHSFCQHVANTNAPLVVSDSREDARVQGNLAIRDLNVIGYLGVPVHNPQGEAIGALCAIQGEPRHWTDGELDTLRDIAVCVDDAIRLRAAKRAAEQQLEQQQAFTYAVSHDVRGPIRTVNFFLDEIIRAGETGEATEVIDLARKALKTTDRMDQYSSDLLTFAETTARSSDRTEIDLSRLLDEIKSDLDARLSEAGGSLTIDPLPKITGNISNLRLLFQNLISNALKFKSPLRPPEISVRSEEDNFYWTIHTTDNGIGISDEYHDQIFELFKRLHSSSEYPGTGVGLALCRQIVEQLGGEITVSSRPGQGSCFSVRFPKPDLEKVPAI